MLWVGLGVLGGGLFLISAVALLRHPASVATGLTRAVRPAEPFDLTRKPDLAALAHRAEPRPVDQLVPPRWLRRNGARGPEAEGGPDAGGVAEGVEITGRRRRPVRIVDLREPERRMEPPPGPRRLQERRGHHRDGLSL